MGSLRPGKRQGCQGPRGCRGGASSCTMSLPSHPAGILGQPALLPSREAGTRRGGSSTPTQGRNSLQTWTHPHTAPAPKHGNSLPPGEAPRGTARSSGPQRARTPVVPPVAAAPPPPPPARRGPHAHVPPQPRATVVPSTRHQRGHPLGALGSQGYGDKESPFPRGLPLGHRVSRSCDDKAPQATRCKQQKRLLCQRKVPAGPCPRGWGPEPVAGLLPASGGLRRGLAGGWPSPCVLSSSVPADCQQTVGSSASPSCGCPRVYVSPLLPEGKDTAPA